jgi:hypothetical protein
MGDNLHLYGFRPYASRVGGVIPPPIPMSVASAQDDQDDSSRSININKGDPLLYVSTGGVIVAKTTTIVSYICAGVLRYYDAADGLMKTGKHYPNATTWGTVEARRGWVLAWPVRDIIWEIDVDDKTTATTKATYEALVHNNFEHVVPGNTANASADPYADVSSAANTATLGWRFVGVSPTKLNQDFAGAYVKMLCVINESGEAASPATGSIVAGI